MKKNQTCQFIQNYGEYDLRSTAGAVVEQYYSNSHPGIKELVHFINWLDHHLQGIPFSPIWDPNISGDYDPTRPAHFLSTLFEIFESYERAGKSIDSLRRNPMLKKHLESLLEGEGGESHIITSNQLYRLYKSGFFKERAIEIKKKISSPDITPSVALSILSQNWEYYVTPACFHNLNRCIEYCIYGANDFPDNDYYRESFMNLIQVYFL